jgi:glycosyltransferase involved in cell wall biosynthesis
VVLDAHDFVSGYLCGLRFGGRFPLLLTVHAKGSGVREMLLDHPALKGTPIATVATHVERNAARFADVVVFPSRGARDLFDDAHPGLLRDKDVRVIYTGIDVEELRSIPADDGVLHQYGVGIGEVGFLLVTVAAMVHDKGLDTLLLGLAALPDRILRNVRVLIIEV